MQREETGIILHEMSDKSAVQGQTDVYAWYIKLTLTMMT